MTKNSLKLIALLLLLPSNNNTSCVEGKDLVTRIGGVIMIYVLWRGGKSIYNSYYTPPVDSEPTTSPYTPQKNTAASEHQQKEARLLQEKLETIEKEQKLEQEKIELFEKGDEKRLDRFNELFL